MSIILDDNVAYTEDYQRYRRSFDWVYRAASPEQDSIIFDHGRYLLSWKTYTARDTTNGISPKVRCIHAVVEDQQGNEIYQIKCITDIFTINHIWHQNGHELLVFNIDLYGYSVFDLTDRKDAHYVPPQIFTGEAAFTWCETMYCPTNNLLVVEGSSWGQPYFNYFYDFSEPLKFPLPVYTNSLDLGQSLGVTETLFSDFTDEGACIINAVSEDGQQLQIEVDVTE